MVVAIIITPIRLCAVVIEFFPSMFMCLDAHRLLRHLFMASCFCKRKFGGPGQLFVDRSLENRDGFLRIMPSDIGLREPKTEFIYA